MSEFCVILKLLLNECIGLISPVEMSLENTTGIIRFERLAVEVNRSDPLR